MNTFRTGFLGSGEHNCIDILEAARGARDYQFSFWDAQLWATALIAIKPNFRNLQRILNGGSAIEGAFC